MDARFSASAWLGRDSGAVQWLATAHATGKFEDPYNAPSVERDERVRIDQTFAMIA
jgi:hypothetical protein